MPADEDVTSGCYPLARQPLIGARILQRLKLGLRLAAIRESFLAPQVR